MPHSAQRPRPIDPQLPVHPLGPFEPKRTGRKPQRPSLPTCRGGRAYAGTAGYVLERSPDHPKANSWGDVPQHRLVMECLIGRLLASSEIVHHRNEIRSDNRPENLELHDRRSHHLVHHAERWKAPLDEAQVRTALEGRTTLEAAEALGVAHQTLRNRFDPLLSKRKSPGGPYSDEFVEKIRAVARDPRIGTRTAAAALETTPWRIRQCCRLHEIEWLAAPAGRPSQARSGADATPTRTLDRTGSELRRSA